MEPASVQQQHRMREGDDIGWARKAIREKIGRETDEKERGGLQTVEGEPWKFGRAGRKTDGDYSAGVFVIDFYSFLDRTIERQTYVSRRSIRVKINFL